MSLPINAADSTPQDGIMLVYQCSLQDDKTFDAAHKAHLEWGTTKKALGFLDNSWIFQPAAGVRDLDFEGGSLSGSGLDPRLGSGRGGVRAGMAESAVNA